MSLRKNIRSKVYMNEVQQEYGLTPTNRIGRTELDSLKQIIETNYASDIPNGKIVALSNGFFIRAIEASKSVVVPPYFALTDQSGNEVGITVLQGQRDLDDLLINSPVSFSGRSERGGKLSYLWDFGDGNTSTSENVNHTYTQAGTYAVSLTISNLEGTAVNRKLFQSGPDLVYDYLTIVSPPSQYTIVEDTNYGVYVRLYNDLGTVKLQYKIVDTSAAGNIFGIGYDEPAPAVFDYLIYSFTDINLTFYSDALTNVSNPSADWATIINLPSNAEGQGISSLSIELMDAYSVSWTLNSFTLDQF